MERVSDLKCPGKDIFMEEQGTRYNHSNVSRQGQKVFKPGLVEQTHGEVCTALFGAAARHATAREEMEAAEGCQGWGLREQNRLPSGPGCLPIASH